MTINTIFIINKYKNMQLSRIYHHNCFIEKIKHDTQTLNHNDEQTLNHNDNCLFDDYFSFEQWIIQRKMAGVKMINPGLHAMLFPPTYSGHVHVRRRDIPIFSNLKHLNITNNDN